MSEKEPRRLNRGEIEKRAEDVLRRHGMTSIPIDPVLLANREGIKIHNAKFSQDGLVGMVARRGEAKTILLNESDATNRKRFTIAHELGHHFLHLLQDGDFIDSDVDLFRFEAGTAEWSEHKEKEVQANQFAAALLMPASALREVHNSTQSISQLAKLFGVSEAAMGIRLSELGIA